MPARFLASLRRAFVRGPAIVVVPAMVAGLLVTAAGRPPEVAPETRKVVPYNPGPGGEYVPLVPARILDTRTANAPLVGGVVRTVSPLGQAGIPSYGVSAVVMVVTAIAPTASSNIVVYPTGAPRPGAAQLYMGAGNNGENAAATLEAKLGTNGTVDVYLNTGQAHLLVDVAGYYLAPDTLSSGGTFVPQSPAAIYSTNDNLNTGTDGTAKFVGGETRNVQVTGVGGVPSGAIAAVIHIQAISYTTTGSYVAVYPAGLASRPGISHVQLVGNDNQRGVAVSKLSSTGKVTVYNNGGSVAVKLVVEGYYVSSMSPAENYYVPVTPARVYSTTTGFNVPNASTAKIGPGATASVQIRGVRDSAGKIVVPNSPEVAGVVLSIVAYTPTVAGYFTAWTNGEPRPIVSIVQWDAGEHRANMFVGKLGSSGKIDIYNSAGETHLLVNVQGYFASSSALPPEAPTNVVATPGNQSLDVSWTAAEDNGFPLSGNTVTVKTQAGADVATYDVSAGAVSKNVTGLTNGTSYVVSVSASNAGGPGPAASAAPVTPYGPPGGATAVTATAGNRSITVNWTPGFANGNTLSGQRVTLKRAPDVSYTPELLSGTAATKTFTGLSNAYSYSVEITAINAAGDGATVTSPAVTPRADSYRNAVLADQPSIYYRLGDTTGTVATDSSGTVRNGTYIGTALGQNGALASDADKSVSMTSGRVTYLSPDGLPVGNAARSVEVWLKTSSTGQQHIAGWGSNVSNQRFFLWLTNGTQLTVERYGGTLRVEHYLPKTIADGKWHHLVVTYSGAADNKTVVYVDGAKAAENTASGGMNTVNSGNYLAIGREPNDVASYFNGNLDEFAIYPSALDAVAVAEHFRHSGLTAPVAPPNVTATPGDELLAIDWDTPAAGVSQGEPAVTDYLVEVKNGGVLRGRMRTPSTKTDAKISGLPAGTYDVSVQACNQWGCSTATTVATVTGAGATYTSLVQDDSPLIYLRLGERAGTVAADSSANRRDANYDPQAVLAVNGAIGGDPDPAIKGNPTAKASLARSIDTTFLPTGAAPRTLSAWVRGGGSVAGWGNAELGRTFGIRVTGTSFQVVGFQDDLTFTTPVSVDDGYWHHVAATFDGTTATAYFDGVALGAAAFPTPLNTAATWLRVGWVADDPLPRSAPVDEVSVFGTALSGDRISTYYGAATLDPRLAIDLPGAMAAPGVTANGTTANVSWTLPSDPTGVTRYEVVVSRQDTGSLVKVHSALAPATSTVVSGLTTGTAYFFAVRAVNNVGTGPDSPKKAASAIPALATGLPPGPFGPTVPAEHQVGDAVWGPEHSPYIVSRVYVGRGETLTILPGTVVKFSGGGGLTIDGQLVAVGTEDKPVVFTSQKDDTVGGDSNGDGNATTPAQENWSSIVFDEAAGSPVSVLDHVEVRYGDGDDATSDSPVPSAGVIQNEGAARLVVSNSRIHEAFSGIGMASWSGSGGWTSVTHNVFTNMTFGVRPLRGTDIIGNVFASSVAVGVRFNFHYNFPTRDIRVAYNDLYGSPFTFVANASDDLNFTITRNNFWGKFEQISDWAPPSMQGNWWGHPVGDPPYGMCISDIWDDGGDSSKYWPTLRTQGYEGDPCGGNVSPVVGYQWDILPALQAPISTWDTAASSDSAVPTAGPVDSANGVLRYEVTDLELNDAGQAMNVRRMYRSDKGSGVLGKGWSTNYSASMTTAPNGTRAVDFASGASMRFQTTGQGEPGVPATMTTSASGASVASSDGSSYAFDAAGVLTGVTLRDPDHKVDLTRTDGKVTAVVGVSGRRFTLGYNGSSLSSVSDSAGRNVGYTVTGDRLTQVDRAGGGAETYGYDASGRLTSITTQLGREILEVGYDAEGRVAWYEQGGAGRTNMEYHPAERYTIVHQPDGVDIRQEYDRYKRMVRQVVVGGRTNHLAIGVGSVPAVSVNGLPAEGTTLAPEVTATRLDYVGNPVEQIDGEGRAVRTSFDSKARPLVTTYADGGTINRHYDAKGRVDSVVDPAGKTWLAEYNAFGQVTKVTDPLLRTQRSVYHPNGDLHEQYDAGNLKTTFGTDAVGRVNSATDPLGHEATTTYTEWNRVKTQTTPRGAVTSTTFDADRNPLTATAPMGRVTTLTYDVFGRVKTIKDAENNVTTLSYDPMSRISEILAPGGGTLTRTYNADGDVKTAVDALSRQTSYDYDNLGNLAKVTDGTNVATVQTYDQSGRLLTRKIGQQTAEVRTYDSKGRLLSVKAPRGATVTTTYDKLDRPVTVTDSVRGIVATRTFDDAGRLATETNALGNTATFGYDASDRLTAVDDEIGRVFLRTFDDGGRMLTDTDGVGFKTIRTYDDDGNVATEKNAGDNGTTVYETDLAGRVTAVVDPLTRRTEIDYDRLDRVVARRSGTNGRLTESFTYDAAGNTLSRRDRAGKLWEWTYDLVNQVKTAKSAQGGITSYEYDLAGRVKKTTDPDGVVSNTEYDASGRPFRVTDGAGAAWVTTYDVDALPTKTTDPDGVSVTYGYDAAGRVLTTKDANNAVTTMTYDAADNVLTRKDPLLHTWASEYDGRSRRTASIDPLGGRTTFTFDAADHHTWTSDLDGVASGTAYGLDGRPMFFEDQDNRRFTTTYDLAGQLRALSIPAAPQGGTGNWSWTYDDVGNMQTESIGTITTAFEHDGEGRVTKVTKPSGRVTTMTHDNDGRLLTEQASNPSTSESLLRSRTYTAAGRPKTAVSAEGTTTWTYDVLGLLTDTTTAEGPSTTSYTPGHRVKTTTVNARAATTATYDTRGLLTSLDGPVKQSYTYDNAQRLTQIAYAAPETGVETFAWDNADRLLRHEQKTSSTATTPQLAESYEYTLGGRVKRETQSAPGRGVAWDKTFGYDTLGRLVSQVTTAADGSKTTEAFTWDDRGNRSGESVFTTSPTGEVTPVSSSTLYHDVAGRITGGAAVTYDADGNLLTSPDGWFSYNAFGEVSAVGQTTQAGTVEATYARDGLGRMVRRTEGATTTSFSYAGTSLDISEQKTGANITTFVREPDGSLAGVVDAGAVSHAIRNRHTDVTGLVSKSTGALTAFATYEPFGQRTGDAAALPLGYQSDYTDPITGAVDMGARAYLPSLGRFTSLDTVTGDPMRPSTFNKFLYGAGDPLGSFDPDGHWPKWVDDTVDAIGSGVEWVVDTVDAVVDTVYDAGRVVVATVTGNDEARDNALDDLSGSVNRVVKQVSKGAGAVLKPLKAVAEGLVQPAIDYLKQNAIARQIFTITVGFAVTAGCGVLTAGSGSVLCLALGESVSSALDSFLTCPPGMSGGECAMAGAISGFATGLVSFGLGSKVPGAKTLLGKIGRAALLGGAGGASGSVVSQLVTTGKVDWRNVAETSMVSAVVGGGSAGAGHLASRASARRISARVDRPDPLVEARRAADVAQGANPRPGTAAALVTADGSVFTATSTRGRSRPPYHPAVEAELASIPPDPMRPGMHGRCAEPRCISDALYAGEDVAGGEMAAASVRAPGNPRHGEHREACPVCAELARRMGIILPHDE